jgi:hypothetical protein
MNLSLPIGYMRQHAISGSRHALSEQSCEVVVASTPRGIGTDDGDSIGRS